MARQSWCYALVVGACFGPSSSLNSVEAAFQSVTRSALPLSSSATTTRPQRRSLSSPPEEAPFYWMQHSQSSHALWPLRHNTNDQRSNNANSKKRKQQSSSPPLTTTGGVNPSLSSDDNQDTNEESGTPDQQQQDSRRRRMRKRVADLARTFVVKPMSTAASMPQGVAAVLKEATMSAIDLAADEFSIRRMSQEEHARLGSSTPASLSSSSLPADQINVESLMNEAFAPVEASLEEVEMALLQAKKSLAAAKAHARDSLEALEIAALAHAQGTQAAVEAAKDQASRQVLADIFKEVNVTDLTFEDVDYGTSEMAPPFLGEDSCLVPGEPVVRVEKAPENSRRIFAGIDIMASVDEVWAVLTDYVRLQDCVPNLIVNEVMRTYDGKSTVNGAQTSAAIEEEDQCRNMAEQMKGAVLRQVGGAKVVGINFSARTTLEVREWPSGLPDFAHFRDEIWEGKSRRQRAKDDAGRRLERYKFPRPFAISSLPTKDISMQNVEDDDGEFRMYQGVWRMQPLPGCAPPGRQAMRLTYAVEVSPRAYLPVQLVERRIAKDLCTNLIAIRDFVAKEVPI